MDFTLLDQNSAEFLADDERAQWFINALKMHANENARRLGESLENRYILKNPLSIIELSGIKQSHMNQRVEKFGKTLIPEMREILRPYRKAYLQSSQDVLARLSLGEGLDKTWSLVTSAFIAFYRAMPEVSRSQILAKLEERELHYARMSDLFHLEYNRIKYELDERGWKRLLEDLAIEAVSRYGVGLMERVFDGDNLLVDPWTHHISAAYFHFWGVEHRNVSSYRTIGKNVKQLNEKFDLQFFPAKPLRMHDDTVDGYVVHAVSMGWFHRKQQLTPVFALTEDPYEDTMQRILQYQAVLAYYKDPKVSPLGVKKRIEKVCPGTLFHFDRTTRVLKIAIFCPAEVLQTGTDLVSISCHYDPEEIQLS